MNPLEKYAAKQKLITKIAVTLTQLRHANKMVSLPKLIRGPNPLVSMFPGEIAANMPSALLGRMTAARTAGRVRGLPPWLRDSVPVEQVTRSQNAITRGTGFRSPRGAIFAQGDAARAMSNPRPAQPGQWSSHTFFDKRLLDRPRMTRAQRQGRVAMPPMSGRGQDPAKREFFNRTMLSHEGAELGKQFGTTPFSSHLSTRPFFHDLNIAATATGRGAPGTRDALRQLRQAERMELQKIIPGLDRLNLGHQRVSRHAMRRLQQAYEKNLPAHMARFDPFLDNMRPAALKSVSDEVNGLRMMAEQARARQQASSLFKRWG